MPVTYTHSMNNVPYQVENLIKDFPIFNSSMNNKEIIENIKISDIIIINGEGTIH